ncbi:MAG: hypothetical protein AVDCRST_MAG79-2242, partial [uncultured Thermoleophilia bacterium]
DGAAAAQVRVRGAVVERARRHARVPRLARVDRPSRRAHHLRRQRVGRRLRGGCPRDVPGRGRAGGGRQPRLRGR